MNDLSAALSSARALAMGTLRATLLANHGKEGVSEKAFRDEWLARLRECPQFTRNGWYDPPPFGMAVHCGHEDDAPGFAHSSLRLAEQWPSERLIDWRGGLMYAYCSPIDLTSRVPADFGITLYFGKRESIRKHFARVVQLSHAVLDFVEADTTCWSLLERTKQLFDDTGVRSNVASVTDVVPLDLGHSLPQVPAALIGDDRELKPAGKDFVKDNRLFLSEGKDWPLSSAERMTIEPSLVSTSNEALPQVSPHYVVCISAGRVSLLTESDSLLRELDLI
jgi:hypothetical protein